MAWTAACCTLMFGSMKLLGVLRVSRDVEIAGLDAIKHGEPAYPLKGYKDGEHPHTIPTPIRKSAVALNLPKVQVVVRFRLCNDGTPLYKPFFNLRILNLRLCVSVNFADILAVTD